VFLDRDGTLIVEQHYLRDPRNVRLEAGVVDGLSALQARGHALIVASNQSGIDRGLLTREDAERVNAALAQMLRAQGIDILAWYICPHRPEAGCLCRKPAAGMALAAARDWGLQLAGSYVIGDRRTDVEMADAIGGTGILVMTGYGAQSAAWAKAAARPVVDGLRAAADYIILNGAPAGVGSSPASRRGGP
jgi:histidinol-phosphate phosphatase family protein